VPLPLAAVGTSVKAVPLLLVAAGNRAKAVAPAASRSRFFPMLKKVCKSSVKTDCEDQATPRGRPKNLSYAPGFGTNFSRSRSHLHTLEEKAITTVVAFAFCKLDRFFQRSLPAPEHWSRLL
jgi:hypothetical protein